MSCDMRDLYDEKQKNTDKINVNVFVSNINNIPIYADEDSSGADLKADITKNITILPGKREVIPTGIRLIIPKNLEIQIRPRSGLAFKHGVTVLNSPGTIDSSYRGEIKVILINHGDVSFVVEPGMRIAQAVCAEVKKINFDLINKETFNKNETCRGTGGFGSTGIF